VHTCRYINTSAITVDEGFSAERTYILLRTLGLRHVTVVDRRVCECIRTMLPAPHFCVMLAAWMDLQRLSLDKKPAAQP